MSAILSPVRLYNPIRNQIFRCSFGSQLNRVVPSLTRLVGSPSPSLTRIVSQSTSNSSMSSEKEAALAASSTIPDSPTM